MWLQKAECIEDRQGASSQCVDLRRQHFVGDFIAYILQCSLILF